MLYDDDAADVPRMVSNCMFTIFFYFIIFSSFHHHVHRTSNKRDLPHHVTSPDYGICPTFTDNANLDFTISLKAVNEGLMHASYCSSVKVMTCVSYLLLFSSLVPTAGEP